MNTLACLAIFPYYQLLTRACFGRWVQADRMSVTDMSSVGYGHDECRRPLPIVGSAVGRTFWKAHIVSIKACFFLSLTVQDWGIHLCYNKDQYTHTRSTPSLVSSITGSYVLCLISFYKPQIYYNINITYISL